MNDISKTRHNNLVKVLNTIKTDLEFCRLADIGRENLSQLKMGITPLGVNSDYSKKLARKLEDHLGLAELSLDQNDFEVTDLAKTDSELSNRTRRMLDTFKQLSEENQQTLMASGLAFLKSSESNFDYADQ